MHQHLALTPMAIYTQTPLTTTSHQPFLITIATNTNSGSTIKTSIINTHSSKVTPVPLTLVRLTPDPLTQAPLSPDTLKPALLVTAAHVSGSVQWSWSPSSSPVAEQSSRGQRAGRRQGDERRRLTWQHQEELRWPACRHAGDAAAIVGQWNGENGHTRTV